MNRQTLFPALVLCLAATAHGSDEPQATTLSADEAIARLQEGNQRFAAGHSRHPHATNTWRQRLVLGQHPFAVIVGCADSRVPDELLFDQGFGDLFVIRAAGNVVDLDLAGSVEYAVEKLHTPVVVVLGHEDCGAVRAALEPVDTDTLPLGLQTLVATVRAGLLEFPIDQPTPEQLAAATRANVRHSIRLLQESEDVRQAVDQGRLRIVGVVYNLHTGIVHWLD